MLKKINKAEVVSASFWSVIFSILFSLLLYLLIFIGEKYDLNDGPISVVGYIIAYSIPVLLIFGSVVSFICMVLPSYRLESFLIFILSVLVVVGHIIAFIMLLTW